ncbi:MAG TPA: hypothetical protein VGF69_13270 [Thermoanaerobaculia bacterium]|jgi:hypothetical protein
MNKTLIACLLLFATSVFAGDGALTVTPAVVQLRGSFGQSTTQTMMITNGTSQPFTFEMVAQDVTVKNGTRTFVEAGERAGSIAATAVYSRRVVQVRPGESERVDVTLTIPTDSPFRGVVVIFRGTNKVMTGPVPMLASIGTLFTFALSDTLDVNAEPLNVTPQSASANLSMTQWCANRGTEPVVAKGIAAILDGSGALVGRMNLTPKRLLPGERAEVSGEYGGELPPGRYKLLVTYDLDGQKSITSAADLDVK